MHLTKTLYIPIEIIDRELGGAVLLASTAVMHGWSVVLGGKQAIFNNMTRFRSSPGIFFMKSAVPGELFKQKEIISYGHRIVSLDVEGLVPSNGEAGVRLRYSAESIEKCDLLFFWGKEHFSSVRNVYPQINHKSYITGSPIIDELKVRGVKQSVIQNPKQKKKILIGTSCGFANHINGIEFSREMRRNAYSDNVSHAEILALELEAYLDIEIFEYWKNAVPLIAKNFPDCDVVLRPHPSENAEFWRSYLKIFKNVRIDSGQPILEELIGANIYIHFNSTSAIAATILKIPTLMPMPPLEKSLQERITYVAGISRLAETPEELIDLINQELVLKSFDDIPTELYRHCENLKPGAMQASDAIIEAVERKYTFCSAVLIIGQRNFIEELLVYLRNSKYFLLWLLARFFDLIGYKTKRMLPPLNAYKSSKAKQPHTSLDKLQSVVVALVEPSALSVLKIKQIAKNLFAITPRADQHDSKA